MSVIEDVRKVIQDLVAPELKSLSVQLNGFERELKVRDELTQAKLETMRAKMEALGAKMDAQYASIMNALDLDKRVGLLERDKQSASA
jgi:hypothetical protein